MSDLRCFGGGRDADNQQTLWFAFNRRPTDDELRFLHDVMRRGAALVEPETKPSLALVPKERT